MRVSYFLHPLIGGINKDGSDIEKNFPGEDGRGAGSRIGEMGADDLALSGPEHRLDGLEAVSWTR